MNHSVLKPFAQTARRELRKQIELRLDYVLRTDSVELRQRAGQVKALRDALAQEGRDALVERVAYTWFNRLAALRFMDANGYHPFGARVVTAATEQETLPEVLQQARAGVLDADLRAQLDTADMFDGVLSGTIPTASKEGTAYRMLLVAACHYYHQLMPFLFEKLGDATELLLPEDLLTEQSVVYPFRTELTDADCRDVEVIGWLYQYYISEKKDAVMARKDAVPTEDIPAVTQLFTPHWIVRYLVENSLGRLWLLNRPSSRLRGKMPYYIEGEAETEFLTITQPEEIKLLDPAGGSGHMLTYAYDLLYSIYEEEGYDAPEIPGLILKHNLYGIDICDRAAALAAFALVMKARGSDSRFFRRVVQPQMIALQNVHFEDGELTSYFKALGVQPSVLHSDFNRLLHQFGEAKNFGSLIQPCLAEAEIRAVRSQITNRESVIATDDLLVAATHLEVLQALDQAEFLSPRYHVVAANPPYMASANFNSSLKQFAEDHFTAGRTDLFALFIDRLSTLHIQGGYQAMIAMHSWLFLASFEELRRKALNNWSILNLIHLGAHAFDSIGGEVVQTAAFVLSNKRREDFRTEFFRIVDGESEREKEEIFFLCLSGKQPARRFSTFGSPLLEIPGAPIAYWASERLLATFAAHKILENVAPVRQGFQTGNNDRFVRLWFEVSFDKCKFDAPSKEHVFTSKSRWVPYNKGGTFRKWYGNNEHLVAFDADDFAALSKLGNCLPSRHLYFKESLTWSAVTAGAFAARYCPVGVLPVFVWV